VRAPSASTNRAHRLSLGRHAPQAWPQQSGAVDDFAGRPTRNAPLFVAAMAIALYSTAIVASNTPVEGSVDSGERFFREPLTFRRGRRTSLRHASLHVAFLLSGLRRPCRCPCTGRPKGWPMLWHQEGGSARPEIPPRGRIMNNM
jgi:hypothetical protein